MHGVFRVGPVNFQALFLCLGVEVVGQFFKHRLQAEDFLFDLHDPGFKSRDVQQCIKQALQRVYRRIDLIHHAPDFGVRYRFVEHAGKQGQCV